MVPPKVLFTHVRPSAHLPWSPMSVRSKHHFPTSGDSPTCSTSDTWVKHLDSSQRNDISVTIYCVTPKTRKTLSLLESCFSPITRTLDFLAPSPSLMTSTPICVAIPLLLTILAESS